MGAGDGGKRRPEARPALGPVSAAERVEVIDVLRGFALFGVLAANMRGFLAPAEAYTAPLVWWTTSADRAAHYLIAFFIDSKFITLFSLLFGLGFAAQMERAEARGAGFVAIYGRRVGVLLAIGLAHGFLLWWGDILSAYAVGGAVLLLFRKRRQETLLTWAMVGYWLPVLLVGLVVLVAALGAPLPEPAQPTRAVLERTVQAYAEGSYAVILAERLKELGRAYLYLLFYCTRILAMFLAGMWLWRTRILQNPAEHLGRIRRVMWYALPIGVLGNLVWPDLSRPSAKGLALMTANSLGVPALSVFYAGGVVLLMQREAWRRRLSPLGAVGRMALSNYLLQSLIVTTLCYSYGFGLFGRIGLAQAFPAAVLIYAAQVGLSVWWLRRFRFGPLEWLWRSLTYGRRQPLRLLLEGQG